jgi:hypothetical protein
MGKAEQRTKDAAMAARLQDHPYHKPAAVRARKAAQYKAFMAKLANKRNK